MNSVALKILLGDAPNMSALRSNVSQTVRKISKRVVKELLDD